MRCKTKWNAQQENSEQTVIKIGQSRSNMQAVPLVFSSKPSKILPARGTK